MIFEVYTDNKLITKKVKPFRLHVLEMKHIIVLTWPFLVFVDTVLNMWDKDKEMEHSIFKITFYKIITSTITLGRYACK